MNVRPQGFEPRRSSRESLQPIPPGAGWIWILPGRSIMKFSRPFPRGSGLISNDRSLVSREESALFRKPLFPLQFERAGTNPGSAPEARFRSTPKGFSFPKSQIRSLPISGIYSLASKGFNEVSENQAAFVRGSIFTAKVFLLKFPS